MYKTYSLVNTLFHFRLLLCFVVFIINLKPLDPSNELMGFKFVYIFLNYWLYEMLITKSKSNGKYLIELTHFVKFIWLS